MKNRLPRLVQEISGLLIEAILGPIVPASAACAAYVCSGYILSDCGSCSTDKKKRWKIHCDDTLCSINCCLQQYQCVYC